MKHFHDNDDAEIFTVKIFPTFISGSEFTSYTFRVITFSCIPINWILGDFNNHNKTT